MTKDGVECIITDDHRLRRLEALQLVVLYRIVRRMVLLDQILEEAVES